MNLEQQLRKYLVMGSQDCDRDPLSILDEAVAAGITAFQFREKGEGSLQGDQKYQLAAALQKRCEAAGVLFIVNDDVELFRCLNADGIHVGQSDEHVKAIREAHPHAVIGLSVSDLTEWENSPVELVDYLGAGPVFPTTSKKDANPVSGTKWIRELKEKQPDMPVVGIGGITTENAHEVIEAGASGTAVISAITQAADIRRAVSEL
ncbi:thiamine phosphate synthase [Halobacillus litoralis]|uniref:Thiamine-phosphate synthase n=1 Tax=Halobacillus litoralis TaxID=45668 RepID=A0A845DSS1_9BACI|nr:thiamine phosphate synthase [Halobacillus litoralis]MYL29550.1 thiamine phosphate synthase [Halobacillus halophilus]MYL36766.1 thiamine phosphate synthase [Halobacillus litoralis]